MESFHSIHSDMFRTSAVFQVEIENGRKVYMGANRSGSFDNERFVTVVDAVKFLKLWACEPYGFNAELSKGNRTSWVVDRKYSSAERGFSFGINNPVPLANVVCNEHVQQEPIYKKRRLLWPKVIGMEDVKYNYVDFNNGITRTIWLLSHGAKIFPVECGARNGIERLVEECGINMEYASVEDLTKIT